MRASRFVFIALALGALLWPPLVRPQAESAAPKLTRAEMETFLRTARILSTRPLNIGVTNSLRATLTDGKITHDAHVQTIDVSKPEFKTDRGVELNFKDSYKFNIAAYRLGCMLGLENIPVSVERKVGGRTAAVTWWVDDVLMDEAARHRKDIQAPEPERWNRQMHIVRVFDQLIYNMDRNLRNLIITRDWDLEMIDHTRSFRIRKDIKDPKNLVKCERGLLTRLRALTRDDLRKQLRPYCNNLEIDALLARRDLIVSFFDNEVKSKGENAVLYDLK